MADSDSNPLILDGSWGEGGGSILRVGAGLACVKNRPLKVINIRKNRNNPGLRPQHLTGIQALKALTNGTLSDVRVGTLELDLYPGSDWKTALDLTIPTAGNVGLLMQTLHNALYRAPIEKCSIRIHGGGTYGRTAPGTSYLQHVTYALFNRIGYAVDLKVIRHGFYPKGGAEVVATIAPNPAGYRGLILEERGELESIEGCIVVEQNLQQARVGDRIKESLITSTSSSLSPGVVMDIKVEHSSAPSVGVGVDVWCRFSSGAILGTATVLGEKGVPSETIGKRAAQKLKQLLDSDATVDENASDQLVPLLCIAQGPSKFKLDMFSSHLQTNLDIIQHFFPREYRITRSGNAFIFEYL
jgi:RNA 3'-terminal phosphate cyclase (ATP)/RNA 3'-terminal phosphate cyclase (GTP)